MQIGQQQAEQVDVIDVVEDIRLVRFAAYSHSIVRMHHNVLTLHDKLFFTCPVYRQSDRQKLTLLISLKNFG